ncbi:MAG: hypothetical protein HYY24_27145 [Verrucomicrobia bacterium]|nr:hypothetical protein [Verrucomicrobiota bacterium]
MSFCSFLSRSTRAAACLFLLSLLTPALHAVTFPLTWRWSNPKPHGNEIFDFISTDGVFLEVCDRGRIYRSDNLTYWWPMDSHTTNALRSIAIFQNQILVAGERGTILRGDLVNGFTFTSLNTTNWLEGLAASPSLAVTVGDNAAIYTSGNGVDWIPRVAGFTNWLRSVAFGNGTFVTVGETGLIATSANGVAWQKRSVPLGLRVNLNKVTWLGDSFWIAGDAVRGGGQTQGIVLTSPTGANWTLEIVGATNDLFAAAGLSTGARLVVGDGEVRLRESGSLWLKETATSKAAPAPGATYYNALGLADQFLISGRAGRVVSGTKTNAVVGFKWTSLDDSFRPWFWDVTRTPSFFIAVGDPSTVMTSADGIDWTLELTPASVATSVFLGVGGTANTFVAVGSQGSIITSTDGALWTAVEPPPVTNDLQGVGALGDLLVVTGGGGSILTSTDGTNWVKRAAPTTTFLSSVTAFPGGLVSVGDQGAILTSPDGLAWTSRSLATANWIYRVRYLGDRLLAVGQNGTILTSTDGIQWNSQTSGTESWLNDVAFIDNTWFAAGNDGTVLASTNTTDWLNIGTITGKSLFGLATANGKLIAVGLEGTVLRSQIVPILSPVNIQQYAHSVTNSTVNDLFFFTGQPDQTFQLEKSGELTNWTTGSTLDLQDSSGTLLYLEVTGVGDAPPRRFFRTRLKL